MNVTESGSQHQLCRGQQQHMPFVLVGQVSLYRCQQSSFIYRVDLTSGSWQQLQPDSQCLGQVVRASHQGMNLHSCMCAQMQATPSKEG